MFRTAFTLTMLVATVVAAQSSDAGTRPAKALNVEGYDLYKEAKWQEAAERFREAFSADPKLAIAHYNFAATVFRSIRSDGCNPSASYDEAFEHLARSLQLDKRRLKRIEEDPDFEEFRHTAGYFVLIGSDVHSVAGITALLPKLRISAPSLQDSGPLFRLEFHPDGTLDLLDHDLLQSGSWTWTRRPGTWRAKPTVSDGGRAVLVEISAPAKGAFPALNHSGLVSAGRGGLLFPDENGRPFAADGLGVCCC